MRDRLEDYLKNLIIPIGCPFVKEECRRGKIALEELQMGSRRGGIPRVRSEVAERSVGQEIMWSVLGSFWPRLRILPKFPGIVPRSQSVC
jgi:hypothetical protein